MPVMGEAVDTHPFHTAGIEYESLDAALEMAQAVANSCGRIVQVTRDHMIVREAFPREVVVQHQLDPL